MKNIDDVLQEIMKWYRKTSAPNSQYKYSRCPICDHAWWDDKEEHNFDCWVPRFKQTAERFDEYKSIDIKTQQEFVERQVSALMTK